MPVSTETIVRNILHRKGQGDATFRECETLQSPPDALTDLDVEGKDTLFLKRHCHANIAL